LGDKIKDQWVKHVAKEIYIQKMFVRNHHGKDYLGDPSIDGT
jgi:hypothetical protein